MKCNYCLGLSILLLLVSNLIYSQTLLYNEDFESFSTGIPGLLQNGWINDTDDNHQWYVDQGGTPSGGTGPNIDHTNKNSTSKYMYVEASGFSNRISNLVSPAIDISSADNPVLQFYYHMYGSAMGTLIVEIESNGSWSTLGVIEGPKQFANADIWLRKEFSIPESTGNVKIRFRGIVGSSFQSDICIDDLSIIDIGTPQYGVKAIGGLSDDYGSNIITSPDGGVYIGGKTKSSGSGGEDFYLIKMDSENQVVWEKTFGGGFSDQITGIASTDDEGVLLWGQTTSYGAGSWDNLLVKVDNTGSLIWSKTIGQGSWDNAAKAAPTTDGGFVVTGYRSVSGTSKIAVIKVDMNGDTLWTKRYGDGGTFFGNDIKQTSDGGYIVAGVGQGTNNGVLMKLNSTGGETWTRYIGYGAQTKLYGVVQTQDGGYITIGTSWNTPEDVLICRTDNNGNMKWTRTLSGLGIDAGWSIINTKDNNFLVCGHTESYGNGNKDVLLVKITIEGTIKWAQTYGGNGEDSGSDVVEGPDHSFHIAGYTNSYGSGGYDLFYLRTDPFGNVPCVGNTAEITMTNLTGSQPASPTMVIGGGLTVTSQSPGLSTPSLTENSPCPFQEIAVSDTLMFQQTIGDNIDEYAYDIVQENDGDYWIVGFTTSAGGGAKDGLIVSTTESGQINMSNTYGGTENEMYSSIKRNIDGTFAIAGYTSNGGTDDGFFIKVDDDGNRIFGKRYGGTGQDKLLKAIPTYDGGYIMVGYAVSFGWGMYVVKVNSIGTLEWARSLPGSSISYGYDIIQTLDGGFLVSGTTNNCAFTGWLVRLNSSGTVLWNKSLYAGGCGSGVDINVKSIIQTTDGGFAGVGKSEYWGAGGDDIMVFRLNNNGDTLWTKMYGGTGNETGEDIIQTTDGGFAITGSTSSAGGGSTDGFLLKINSNGDTLFSKTYGGSSADYLYAVQETAAGGFVMVGNTQSFGAGNSDVYLIKTDFKGNSGNCFEYPANFSIDNTSMVIINLSPTPQTATTVTSYNPNPVSAPLDVKILSITTNGSVTDVACNGGTSGAVNLNVVGGEIPVSYSWSNGATTQSISSLTQGTYTVTVDDNYGCSVEESFDITEPVALSTGITGTDVTCYLGADGTASAIPAGGTPPYQYNWSNGSQDSTATALPSGGYSVNVFDNKGCLSSNITVINQPSPLTLSITGVDPNCFNGSDGTSTVSPSGGTSPYSYNWSSGGTDAMETGLSDGTYVVMVTDACGDSQFASYLLTEPDSLEAELSGTNISCFNADDGEAVTEAWGGTTPYSYAWSHDGSEVDPDVYDLGNGNIIVTVTDDCGISDTGKAFIVEPSLLLTSISGTNVSCNNGFNGTANVAPSGGTPPYEFFWNNGQTNATAVNLFPGNYLVNIYDDNGCQSTEAILITEPNEFDYNLNRTNNNCLGGSTGTATIIPIAGSSPYTFNWDNGQTNATATGLTSGLFAFTVTDSCGVSFLDTVEIDQPDSLDVSTYSRDMTCNGVNDGRVWVIPEGGTPPYSFIWDNAGASTSSLVQNLGSRSYNVTVTDFCGINMVDSSYVDEPDILEATILAANVTCYDSTDGAASVTISGGTPPYVYNWNNGLNTALISNLWADFYLVNVTDSNGCLTSQNVSITEPDEFYIELTVVDDTCFGANNGDIIMDLSGGTSPYSFIWSQGATTSNLLDVSSGSYSVTATDGCGAVLVETDFVDQPDSLEFDISSSDISCFGTGDGDALVSIYEGTTPYSVLWDDGSTDDDIYDLDPGYVVVTVSDYCLQTLVDSVMINEPTVLSSSMSAIHVSCNSLGDGSATVSISGGSTPYSYQWNNGQTSTSAVGLFPGFYSVNVFDVNGCLTSNNITITQPNALTSTLTPQNASCGISDGGISSSINGGVTPYSYNWSNGQSTANASVLSPGNVILTVTDANGCTNIDSSSIVIESQSVDICVVTVDITSSRNVVVWTKPIANNIDSFLVYRDISGTYTEVGSVAYPDLSQFEDSMSGINPNSTSYRYKISVLDTCGVESLLSDYHETMHLTTNLGLNGRINLIWDNYEGFNFNYYRILRDSTGTGTWQVLDSVTANNFTYSDLNPPSGNVDYAVEVMLAGPCNATRSVSHNSSRSNISTMTNSGGASGITATTSSTNTAAGSCTGSASATPTGGTTPYYYSWDGNSGNQTGSTATGLCAGTFSVTVTDAMNATTIVFASVGTNQGSAVSATTNSTDASAGNCDGVATVVASGGITPYSYAWDGNAGSQTTSSATGLCSGTFAVTVTDAVGTQTSAFAIVGQGAAPTVFASTSATDASSGQCDGTASVSATGGIGSYSYQWDGNSGMQTGNTATGLCAGTYSVTVTDSIGTSTTAFASVGSLPAPPPLSASLTGTSATSGNCDGSAAVNAAGGNDPYVFAWDSAAGNQTDSLATGLCAGTYSVTVSDQNGDSLVLNVSIGTTSAGGTPITASTSSINASFGTCDGSALVSASGGDGPLNYLWDGNAGAQTSANATGLCPGTYSVTVSDSTGTATNVFATVGEESGGTSLSATTSSVNENGTACDGTGTVTPSGGISPYTYLWDGNSGNQTGSTATGLCSGTYSIMVSDSIGQNTTVFVTVGTTGTGGNGGGSITATTSANNASFGNCDGTASATPTSGTGPYTFIWDGNSGSQTGATATGLCPGTYSVVVTDSLGASTTVFASVGQNSPTGPTLSATTTSNSATFGNCDGDATVNPSGGSSPYTYAWDGNSGNQTGVTATGLCPGSYSVLVTDSLGLTTTVFATVGETAPAGPALNASTSTTSATSGNCDGTATVNASGGTAPFTYQWDGNTSNQITQIATGLCTGTYSVTVTDSLGLTTAVFAFVNQQGGGGNNILASTTSNNATFGNCDGTATVTPSGGTSPYSYNWDGNAGGQTDSMATGLCPGTYSVVVSDAGGNTTTVFATVGQNNQGTTPLVATTSSNNASNGNCDGSATVNVTGGTSPYSYMWDGNAGSQTGTTANNLCPGTYSVVVTDANGTTTTVFATVGELVGIIETSSEASMSVFPNPAKDVIHVQFKGVSSHTIELGLYSSTGQLVNQFRIQNSGSTPQPVQLNKLASGVYFLRAVTGEEVFNERLIVR